MMMMAVLVVVAVAVAVAIAESETEADQGHVRMLLSGACIVMRLMAAVRTRSGKLASARPIYAPSRCYAPLTLCLASLLNK